MLTASTAMRAVIVCAAIAFFAQTAQAAVPALDVSAVKTPSATVKNGTYVGRYLPEYNEDVFSTLR